MIPKPKQLEWKKRKDGTLICRDKKVYTVTLIPPVGSRLYEIFRLSIDGVKIYESPFQKGKASCKNVASYLAGGYEKLYSRTLKHLTKKSQREKFTWEIKDVFGLTEVPHIDGPHYKFFLSKAQKGISPRQALCDKHPLDEDELTDDYLDSITVELWPTYGPIRMKRERSKTLVTVESKPPENRDKPALKAISSDSEQYSGSPPEERDSNGLERMYLSIEKYPSKFKLEDAKFSSILKWAELVRDYFQARGKFMTIQALAYFVRTREFTKDERREKAVNRLRLIFSAEYDREKAINQQMILNAGKEEIRSKEPKKKATFDKFGRKVGSRGAVINAVLTDKFKSARRVMRDSKQSNPVHGHLNWLVKNGFVEKKLRKGILKFRLVQKETPSVSKGILPKKKNSKKKLLKSRRKPR